MGDPVSSFVVLFCLLILELFLHFFYKLLLLTLHILSSSCTLRSIVLILVFIVPSVSNGTGRSFAIFCSWQVLSPLNDGMPRTLNISSPPARGQLTTNLKPFFLV